MPKISKCRECGTPIAKCNGVTGGPLEFCNDTCRKRFNNRRAIRGAELYDAFMTMRYDRAVADKAGAWNMLCRMAQRYHAQDDAERSGRKSWGNLKSVRERHASVLATVVEKRLRAGR